MAETGEQQNAGPQRVVIAIGLPGSGKSTWFTDNRIQPLSSDHMRELLLDNVEDQSHPAEIHGALLDLLRRRLQMGRAVSYLDATNLLAAYRAPVIELAKQYDARVEALWFDTPLAVCLQRNRGRPRNVPEDVILDMAQRFDPPAVEEGFDRVIRIKADEPQTPLA